MTVQTIRQVAKELAANDWDQGTHSERYRKLWPDVKQYVGRAWPQYVPMAKLILVEMLQDKTTSQSIKDAVYDALVEDGTRNANRKGVTVGRGTLNLNPEHPGRMERKIFHDT